MEISPKPTAWIGLGVITVAALAAGYALGRTSAERDNQTQSHQDAASEDDPDLRSTLSATRRRLASCEETLQRRDSHLHKREEKPDANEDKHISSPESELPKQCIIATQAMQLKTMAANCFSFRWQFNAYKKILGSDALDCETVLSIRDLARSQHSICTAVARSFEEASQPDVASSVFGIDAMESAYMFMSDYGDVDVDGLVKNPECVARIRTE